MDNIFTSKKADEKILDHCIKIASFARNYGLKKLYLSGEDNEKIRQNLIKMTAQTIATLERKNNNFSIGSRTKILKELEEVAKDPNSPQEAVRLIYDHCRLYLSFHKTGNTLPIKGYISLWKSLNKEREVERGH